MTHLNKLYHFIEHTSKMTFIGKKNILCKNVIGIIKKLETNFIHDTIMNSHNNIIQQQNNLITVIYITNKKNERSINFLTISKLFKISGF